MINQSNSNHYSIISIVLIGILIRWIISLNTYSGYSAAPMFGDFEAQRHWMEITYNLDYTEWYTNTTNNDLGYWGLDYPPLTAYHSYLMGISANKIDPKFVELYKSRGIETGAHKLFMRLTVLVSDLVIFFLSVKLLVNNIYSSKNVQSMNSDKDYLVAFLLVLLNPTIILIDHGHFQYNCVSLGFMQLAVYFLISNDLTSNNKLSAIYSLSIGSFWFCLALNYKQMELYHALPFFFYLLSLCISNSKETIKFRILKLSCVGLTVIFTFLIIWLPFVLNGLNLTLAVLSRIFPFSRGLFEDKVANFWCSLSVVLKLKEKFPIETLSKSSIFVTGLFNLPSCINLYLRPTRPRFLLSIINSSLIFYLFSFQVHEKSILLATIPACLLVNKYPFVLSWFITIANLSMLPLLQKDGLALATLSLTSIFSLVIYYCSEQFWPTLNLDHFKIKSSHFSSLCEKALKLMFIISHVGIALLVIGFLFVKPPSHLPDLWTVFICVFSCAHFFGFSLIFNLIQFTLKSTEQKGDFPMEFNCCFSRTNKKKLV